MADEYVSLLVAGGYGFIAQLVESFLGGLGVPADLVLALVGWWKKDTAWGKGLLYGAITSLGQKLMAGTLRLGFPTVTTTQPSTQSQVIYVR